MPQAPKGRPRLAAAAADKGGASPILDFALFPAVLAIVLLAFVSLPIGLVAGAAQDGLNEQMRAGLGVEGPLPLRVFRALHGLLRFWPLGLGVAWIHVALRLVRRRSPFGESLPRDVLVSPLLTTAVLGTPIVAWILAHEGGHAVDALVWPGALVAVSAFLTLGLAGLLLALGRRHRGFRLAVAVVVVAAVGARVGAEAWGRAALHRHAARRAPERALEDERRAARTRPILRGEAIEEDAWPRYQQVNTGLQAHLDATPAHRELTAFGDREPFAPIPPVAKAVLVARRADVQALREATHCHRCRPVLPANLVGPIPSMLGFRYLAILVTLEGSERAQAGDLSGAADRYLDLVRFGGDISEGILIHALVGSGTEQAGLRALGRLVRSGRLDVALLDRIERERQALEAGRASLARSLAHERRILDGLGDALDTWSSDLGEPLVLETAIPYRALAAHAVGVATPLCREFETALEEDDLEAWTRLVSRSDATVGRSWNPLLRLAMGYGGIGDHGTRSLRLFLTARGTLAWFRLVQAAIQVERAKRTAGGYPREAPDLPGDPFVPGHPLHYRREGSSYRLWSVGTNGIDDGAQGEKGADVVLE